MYKILPFCQIGNLDTSTPFLPTLAGVYDTDIVTTCQNMIKVYIETNIVPGDLH